MSPHSRRRRIAFFVNDLSSTYQARFFASVEKATKQHDADLLALVGREHATPHPDEAVQNLLYSEWLDRQRVDGVIVLSAAIANFCGTDGLAQLCARLELPVCSIGLRIPGVPSIVIENRAGMRVAVEHLARHHSRRRIAYISGPRDNEEAVERLRGCEDALSAAGLSLDPALVAYGHFTAPTGRAAMQQILERTRDFDGLAVANDDMAIGATELLREKGISVSEDVLVTSFDNTPNARYAVRSLTSVSQPTDQMADRAVRELFSILAGGRSEDVIRMDVQLVLRESCGCGYLIRSESLPPAPVELERDALTFIRSGRAELIAGLHPPGDSTGDPWKTWTSQLMDALETELLGKAGTFLRIVEEIAEQAARARMPIDEISRAVSQLRAEFAANVSSRSASLDLEKLWVKALTILGSATTRLEGQAALRTQARANELRYVNQRLSLALDAAAVAAALGQSLSALGIETALFARCLPGKNELEPLLAVYQGETLALPTRAYASRQLFPDGFPPARERCSLFVLLLSFEDEALGLVALESKTDAFVGEALRSQLGASLKLGTLHARVLEETALRERLSREQLLGEMAIAKRLQTVLAPKRLDVPGLEIAAFMQPADEVGGDYYDVLPIPGGCWIGIGDVSGHGLLSGLIMLMIQSIVSTLVGTRPDATPAELVGDLNAVLFPNVRERLGADEHATLMLLRYHLSGKLEFAGAHEDLIVYRQATKQCELVQTDGLWLAVRADIRRQTRDQTLVLEPGDLLVLYTDGVTEARNSLHEHFALERLCGTVEEHAEEPVGSILQEILAAVHAWFPVQQDDVTCLVARYTGPS